MRMENRDKKREEERGIIYEYILVFSFPVESVPVETKKCEQQVSVLGPRTGRTHSDGEQDNVYHGRSIPVVLLGIEWHVDVADQVGAAERRRSV